VPQPPTNQDPLQISETAPGTIAEEMTHFFLRNEAAELAVHRPKMAQQQWDDVSFSGRGMSWHSKSQPTKTHKRSHQCPVIC